VPVHSQYRPMNAADGPSSSQGEEAVPPALASLVVLRHCESTWSETGPSGENRFAGWDDTPVLTERGETQARSAAGVVRAMLARVPEHTDTNTDTRINSSATAVPVALAATSVLRRAIKTLDIMLKELGASQATTRVVQDVRLNERCYGCLEGQSRPDIVARFGKDTVRRWRRGVLGPREECRPPRKEADGRGPARTAECFLDVADRVDEFFRSVLRPALLDEISSVEHRARGDARPVVVVTHGSVVRAFVRLFDRVPDAEIEELEIDTGQPRIWRFSRSRDTHAQEDVLDGIAVVR
jgi:2,3-bisphosphoglycerate-dependent phosphoglycerate mutase